MKQLKVDAIRNGTVIDHIRAGNGLPVANLLNLAGSDILMIGVNFPSNKYVRKDLIKIENRRFSASEVNIITLITPTATLITIEDYEVVEKIALKLPKRIEKLILCPNQNCITSRENIDSKFNVVEDNPVKVRCGYCEKKYSIEEVTINLV